MCDFLASARHLAKNLHDHVKLINMLSFSIHYVISDAYRFEYFVSGRQAAESHTKSQRLESRESWSSVDFG